ncbi:transcription termination factor NusA [candidate division WWE3 bacterium RIFCSPHIGHO2_01_FULL_40_23]|uniref:Transcription termination/antitermination protein NusA n=1 Tax=candidate division WWE3 bacterium RIFCSPLOWO2_01_FULL_41_18 TaxID=1802625 RepID=A0A1F4VDI9_UNCKA|nr:MAG: transcription termination factor NusA [candidate division WWE3 bacterium RIFCSPHIGHO2_01_FULL_40_23]OGC55219.1 MAG: transcription termination factor NusA [candidate division WWE3 bacterium RIFCSPLOWO2_01_FULL_41_18]
MAISEFNAALNQVATERGIPVESVLETIRAALVSAYKKDYGSTTEDITATVDSDTGEAKIYKGGEDVTPSGFGRIAAQTAKQVILQKIRESEKETVFADFKKKIGTIVNAHIFRMEKGVVIVDLGKAQGILPQSEQIQTEKYSLNQKLKVLVKDIREGGRGLEIIVSRADPLFVSNLFAMEVPEVAQGVVRVEAISREPGSRTKIAVSSKESNVDPVGSCVGQKGVRVQAIIAELNGEKIDIIPYNPEIDRFIAASLSPAKVADVIADRDNKEAKVIVPDDQLSLAIGKEGQNVRLAAKLTGWRIDIKGLNDTAKPEVDSLSEEEPAVESPVEEKTEVEEDKKEKVSEDSAQETPESEEVKDQEKNGNE